MIVRILAAVVALLVLVPILAFGGELGVALLVPLVGLICANEYVGMAFPKRRMAMASLITVSAGAMYASLLYGGGYSASIPATFGLVIMLLQIASLFDRAREGVEGRTEDLGRLFTGVFWLTLLVFVPLLRQVGLVWLVMALCIAWSSDTGAYFSGRLFGKRKLYVLISPNKTWEGVFGGLATCIATVMFMNMYFQLNMEWYVCVVVAVLCGSLSVVGDLLESLMKRSYGVKDSGRIMPGHGGLLDRVDSLLFVCPALYTCIHLFQVVK